MMFPASWSDLGAVFSGFVLAIASYQVYRFISLRSSPAPLPPGPKPLPLLGNLLDFPTFQPWEVFSKWGETYGRIVCVQFLGQIIIILNDPRDAIDMLDKKGSLYSDRPTLVMGGQLVGWDEGPALIQFGSRWAEYRRLLSQFMGTKAKVDAFAHVLREETNAYVKHVFAEPHDWVEHTRRFAGGIVLQLAYGYKASDPRGDELVKLVDNAMEGFSETTMPNAFLVDVFPILRYVPSWLPGASWKRKATRYHDYLQEMLQAPFELVKQQMASGIARPSFTQSYLEGQRHTPEKERMIQWAAAGIYSGGADTTVAGIECFLLGITRHIAEQKAAQAEIDAVVGRDCLPTSADRERLPYCEGLYLEIIRCYTFGPLGLAHVAREDDLHDGYLIPKRSVVITNNWQFYHDPKTYPNPEAFAPERFIGEKMQYDPRKYLFGYGRRTCPGLHLADASMWLACISILAAFDVAPPMKNGKPVVPPPRFMNSAISRPEHFECTIRPRSEEAETLMRALPG